MASGLWELSEIGAGGSLAVFAVAAFYALRGRKILVRRNDSKEVELKLPSGESVHVAPEIRDGIRESLILLSEVDSGPIIPMIVEQQCARIRALIKQHRVERESKLIDSVTALFNSHTEMRRSWFALNNVVHESTLKGLNVHRDILKTQLEIAELEQKHKQLTEPKKEIAARTDNRRGDFTGRLIARKQQWEEQQQQLKAAGITEDSEEWEMAKSRYENDLYHLGEGR